MKNFLEWIPQSAHNNPQIIFLQTAHYLVGEMCELVNWIYLFLLQ